jgi:BASS family bile acid:Na+ symporter
MLSVGLAITVRDLLKTIERSDLVLKSLAINFFLAGIGAVILTQALPIPQNTTIAILLAAAAPGAPFAPKLASIAGGDLSVSTGLTFILSTCAVLILPTIANSIYSGARDNSFALLAAAVNLLVCQLLPLLVGFLIRGYNPLLAKYLVHPLAICSDLLLAILVVLLLSENFGVLLEIGWSSLVAIAVFNLFTAFIGWLFGGAERKTRISMTLTSASRNLSLVLLIAVANLPTSELKVSVIAFSVVELIFTLLLAFYFRWFSPTSV